MPTIQKHATRLRSPRRSEAATPRVRDGRAQRNQDRPVVHTELTRQEIDALERTGVDLTPHDFGPDDPIEQCAALFSQIREESLTTPEAARCLGVNESRIRQRLTQSPRTLFGIKLGQEWRIPRFQFDEKLRPLPGIDQVVAALPLGIHPVSFLQWFTIPSADLIFNDRELSPRDWLRTGNPPDSVVEIAAHLGYR